METQTGCPVDYDYGSNSEMPVLLIYLYPPAVTFNNQLLLTFT